MDNYDCVQQGWQCPLCKRVYSPFTPCCLYCGAEGMAKDCLKSVTTGKLNINGHTITYPLKGEESD